jgi:glutamyl-Q tRNA(Asp) synthetase
MARASGGRFLLRIEDIDTARCRPEFVAHILDDLAWLGLTWDGPAVVQSTRDAEHVAAFDRLGAMGLLYPCACTRTQIMMSAPHGDGGIYPGTCRQTPVALDDPRPVAWRLDVTRAVEMTGPLTWHDTTAGTVAADPLAGGDVVLGRKGIGTAYHLAVVVDDAAQGVSDVVRGRDLFTATHVQRLLQALLDLPTPRYHHHALVTGPDGKRLAKRTPGATIAEMRAQGADPGVLAEALRADRLPIGFARANP